VLSSALVGLPDPFVKLRDLFWGKSLPDSVPRLTSDGIELGINLLVQLGIALGGVGKDLIQLVDLRVRQVQFSG
jgi:hypothetical protein